jgi:hypothetical protein
LRLAPWLAVLVVALSANASASVNARPPAGDLSGARSESSTPNDGDESVARYYDGARRGDAEAIYRLALRLSNGRGVRRNVAESLVWLRKAAAQNHAEAEYRLAAVYTNGAYGVPRDMEAGAKWLRRSARHGNADAQYALGSLYVDGQGVQRNAIKALQWIAEAARNGHQSAIQTLLRLRGEQQRGRAASSRSVPYPLP